MVSNIDNTVDERVMQLWDKCFRVYLQYGYKLKFPANTDPHKTYHWRHLLSLHNNFEKYGLDDYSIDRFIHIAVKHIKNMKLLCKGLSALNKKSTIEYVYKELIKENSTSERLINIINSSRSVLLEKTNGGVLKKDIVAALLIKEKHNRSYAITNLYLSKKLSIQYMSLSYSCARVVLYLNDNKINDAHLLPSMIDLFVERSKLIARDPNFVRNITEILANDWRNV
jgi:hypothetical protein